MKIADIPALRDAPLTAKLELVEELWAEIVAKSDTIPLPDWHAREIDQSLAQCETNPGKGRPRPDGRAGILSQS